MAPDRGEGGPSVLLVHGQPGSGADWRAVAALLEADHRVLAPDRPGWGSGVRPAMGLAGNAATLAGLAEEHDLHPPLTVVGHSFGGGVALEMAMLRPDLVGALVLIGSVGTEQALGLLDRVLAVPVVGNPVIRAGMLAARRSLAVRRMLARPPGGAVISRLVSLLQGLPVVSALAWLDEQPIESWNRASFLVEQKALVEETPALERGLSHLRLPVAVVHGTEDHIVPPRSARLLAERVPGAELIWLQDEGHLPLFDCPERIAPIVRRYAALAAR